MLQHHTNFTKSCACREKWHGKFTKYRASHEKSHFNITTHCACHGKWHCDQSLSSVNYSFSGLLLDCPLIEQFLDWIFPWLNFSLAELVVDWTIPGLNNSLTKKSLTETVLDWTSPWLNTSLTEDSLTEEVLDWTIPWLNHSWIGFSLAELFLDWMKVLTELFLDLVVFWLNPSFFYEWVIYCVCFFFQGWSVSLVHEWLFAVLRDFTSDLFHKFANFRNSDSCSKVLLTTSPNIASARKSDTPRPLQFHQVARLPRKVTFQQHNNVT